MDMARVRLQRSAMARRCQFHVETAESRATAVSEYVYGGTAYEAAAMRSAAGSGSGFTE